MRTVLCYGDSNTHGTMPMHTLGERNRYDPDVRWTGVLAGRLGSLWQVVEEGHPGRTTVLDDPIEGPHKNGRTALPVILESHRPIDLVIIMLGTNDLKFRFCVNAFDIADSAGKLAEIAKASLCGPGETAPQVLLVAPPPVTETGPLADMFQGGAATGQQFPEQFAAVAERYGCAFLDAGKVIRSSAVDGVHYDAGDHKKLGDAVADAVHGLFGA
jgi:lysophospholipase L1-like esterase